MPRFSDPEPLSPGSSVEEFDCGVQSLNQWLLSHASNAMNSGSARVYAVRDSDQDRIIGYHALAAASISPIEATTRARRGMPRSSIPAVLLARLAVDRSVQGLGLGAYLLRDAMVRTLSVSQKMGVRLMLVHAIDETARSFYLRHGFELSPSDPFNLQILVKDIRASLNAS